MNHLAEREREKKKRREKKEEGKKKKKKKSSPQNSNLGPLDTKGYRLQLILGISADTLTIAKAYRADTLKGPGENTGTMGQPGLTPTTQSTPPTQHYTNTP